MRRDSVAGVSASSSSSSSSSPALGSPPSGHALSVYRHMHVPNLNTWRSERRSSSGRRRWWRRSSQLQDHALSELDRSHVGRAAVPKLLKEAGLEDEVVVAVVASTEVR